MVPVGGPEVRYGVREHAQLIEQLPQKVREKRPDASRATGVKLVPPGGLRPSYMHMDGLGTIPKG